MSEDKQNINKNAEEDSTPKRKPYSQMTEFERENYKKRRDVMIKKKMQQVKEQEGKEDKEAIYTQLHSTAVQVKPTTFKGKWANYWYHYKFVTWITVFVVALVTFFVYDMVTKPEYDYDIMLLSEINYMPDYLSKAEEALMPLLDDVNGDGEVNFMLQSALLTGDESADPSYVMAGQVRFSGAISDGLNYIFVVDDYTYAFMKSQEIELYDLSQLSDDPNVDGDKFLLNETPGFSEMLLDNNLYLVIRDPEGVYTEDEEAVLERFEDQIGLVEDIINFK